MENQQERGQLKASVPKARNEPEVTNAAPEYPKRKVFDTSIFLANAIKLGGLGVAINELLIRSELRPGALAIAAFMMAGAQGLESFLQAFLGTASVQKPEEK